MDMFETIRSQAGKAVLELLEIAKLERGALLVIGCSSSEVMGHRIGAMPSLKAAEAIYQGIAPLLQEKGIHLAAQCCEHLNRSLVIEKEVALSKGYEIVNAIPQEDAGGSFATTVYQNMNQPVLVASVLANAGMDIGGTLIGMHLKAVAVPVRLSIKSIGEAFLLCARTRPRYAGGPRARFHAY